MSNKNLYSHIKSDKIKWIAIATAIFLIAVMLVGICLQVFGKGKQKPSEWFNNPETEQEQTEKDGLEVEQAEGTGGLTFVSAKIAPAQYGEYGIMSIVDSAYTLTATLTPADAENKKVTYSAAWSNSASSWATGKNVTDYVTITQETDGALKATLTCKQAFGEKIVATCTSQANASAKATADLQYKQRITGYDLKITGLGNTLNYSTTGTKTGAFKADFNQTASSTFEVTVNKSDVYTKENTDSVTKVVLTPTSGLTSAITEASLSADKVKATTVNLTTLSGTLAGFLDSAFGSGIYESSAANRNKLINALKGFTSAAYNIELYNDSTKVADGLTLTIDSSVISGQKVVESVELDNTEIVF